jgi:hypothetical protein
MSIRKSCAVVVLLCLLGSTALAGIMAEVSCRTEGGSNVNINRHDSSKLSVRASAAWWPSNEKGDETGRVACVDAERQAWDVYQ